jgi:hypothetical protein
MLNFEYNHRGQRTLSESKEFSTQWDVVSRIVSMNDGKYDYDKTSQLVTANYAKLPAEKYEYDLNGNRSNYRTGALVRKI